MENGIASFNAFKSQSPETFGEIAKLISGRRDPEPWIAEVLKNWSPTVFVDIHVQSRQPTRREMVQKLKSLEASATYVATALQDPAVLDFLQVESPIDRPDSMSDLMRSIAARASTVKDLPALVRPDGRIKAGTGKALLSPGNTAEMLCTMVIAELWNTVRGAYPKPANPKATEAAQRFWTASGGTEETWGSDKAKAWINYFKKLEDPALSRSRSEIREHCKLASSVFHRPK